MTFMKNGFTLIEIIISVAIISLVSVSAMYAIGLNLSSAFNIKNNLIASSIAQEGLEVVRNIRDKDSHAGAAFGVSLSNGDYRVEWSSFSLLPFQDVFLKRDSSGYYSYSSGQDTIFKRKITIGNSLQNGPAIEKVAKVEVSWNEKSGPKAIQAELRLFNW